MSLPPPTHNPPGLCKKTPPCIILSQQHRRSRRGATEYVQMYEIIICRRGALYFGACHPSSAVARGSDGDVQKTGIFSLPVSNTRVPLCGRSSRRPSVSSDPVRDGIILTWLLLLLASVTQFSRLSNTTERRKVLHTQYMFVSSRSTHTQKAPPHTPTHCFLKELHGSADFTWTGLGKTSDSTDEGR